MDATMGISEVADSLRWAVSNFRPSRDVETVLVESINAAVAWLYDHGTNLQGPSLGILLLHLVLAEVQIKQINGTIAMGTRWVSELYVDLWACGNGLRA